MKQMSENAMELQCCTTLAVEDIITGYESENCFYIFNFFYSEGTTILVFPQVYPWRIIIFPVSESTASFRVLVFSDIVENLGYVLDKVREFGFSFYPVITEAQQTISHQ